MNMTTIRAPSGELLVEDAGDSRRITLNGKAIVDGKLVQLSAAITTPLRIVTLERLVNIKGDWWLDEIERRSKYEYIRKRLETLVNRFGSFQNARILDIGSGSGSSALVMLDCGAASVVGVEPSRDFVDLARRRAEDEAVADRLTFIHHTDTAHLPFPDASFDIVTFNAVIEHIPPELRAPILREAYRCLAPSGLLVIDETPNRAAPYDNHTTRLPLLPWLPLWLSYPLARRFSRVVARGMTKDEYVSAGLVGGSYWAVRRALKGADCLNRDGGDAQWICSRKTCGTALRFFLVVAETILRFVGLPLAAFMPTLDLVFRKPARSPSL